MPSPQERQVSRSREIAVPASEVFDFLASPAKHVELDGSGTVKGVLRGPERVSIGDSFWMRMRIVLPYVIRNTVVEWEEDRLIAWHHPGHHRWRWELEPLDDDRTRVTETFDWSTARSPRLLELAKVPQMNAKSLDKTLERLASLLER